MKRLDRLVVQLCLVLGILALAWTAVGLVSSYNPDYIAYSVVPILLGMLTWAFRRAFGEKSQEQKDDGEKSQGRAAGSEKSQDAEGVYDWLHFDFEITEKERRHGRPFAIRRVRKAKDDDFHIVE